VKIIDIKIYVDVSKIRTIRKVIKEFEKLAFITLINIHVKHTLNLIIRITIKYFTLFIFCKISNN